MLFYKNIVWFSDNELLNNCIFLLFAHSWKSLKGFPQFFFWTICFVRWWWLLNCDVVCDMHVDYWLVLIPILPRQLWCANETGGMRLVRILSFSFFFFTLFIARFIQVCLLKISFYRLRQTTVIVINVFSIFPISISFVVACTVGTVSGAFISGYFSCKFTALNVRSAKVSSCTLHCFICIVKTILESILPIDNNIPAISFRRTLFFAISKRMVLALVSVDLHLFFLFAFYFNNFLPWVLRILWLISLFSDYLVA